mgnify:CR=1 FL=1
MVFSIFFSLVIILNVFEEVSYLKDVDTGLLFPFFLTILNSPSIVYETFPFIFFISTQFLFIKQHEEEMNEQKTKQNRKFDKRIAVVAIGIGLFEAVQILNGSF